MGVISLILILVVFGPFFMAATMGKSGNRAMKRDFRKTIKDLKLHFSPREQWANFLIGIDSRQGILLYISAEGGVQNVQRISLQGLQDCEIGVQERPYRTRSNREQILERLELELRFGQKREPVRLLFYQKSDAYSENQEKQRAERWRGNILQVAAPKTPIRAAA